MTPRNQKPMKPATQPLVEVDEAKVLVRVKGEVVDLTPKEYALLVRLRKAQGAVVGREALLNDVWDARGHDLDTRTVDQHVSRLRKKLRARLGKTEVIHTIFTGGFAYDEARG